MYQRYQRSTAQALVRTRSSCPAPFSQSTNHREETFLPQLPFQPSPRGEPAAQNWDFRSFEFLGFLLHKPGPGRFNRFRVLGSGFREDESGLQSHLLRAITLLCNTAAVNSSSSMQNLKYGDSSPVVAQIQTALNFAGPSRLPRSIMRDK